MFDFQPYYYSFLSYRILQATALYRPFLLTPLLPYSSFFLSHISLPAILANNGLYSLQTTSLPNLN